MDNIKKKNINFWTVSAPGIDNQVTRETVGTLSFFKKVDEVRYKQEPYIINYFNEILKSGIVSLEVGCGLGTDLRTFSSKGLKVTGLDYSPENAYLSQLGLEVSGLPGRVFCGDAENLPFPDNSFDFIYSYGCLHHTPNTQKSIDQIFRTLKPGGQIMIMLYHKGYQFWYILFKYLLFFKWLGVDLQTYISSQYDQTPLSQMFSKRQLLKMFKNFTDVDIRIETFGGIQSHKILKYIWKIFVKFPYLKKRLGTFAFILAKKSGELASMKTLPQICCPICHSALDIKPDVIKCLNEKCKKPFSYYKGKIPILHVEV